MPSLGDSFIGYLELITPLVDVLVWGKMQNNRGMVFQVSLSVV